MESLLSNNFIPTKEASELTGYHSEYLARLAREKKIAGQQLGRVWLIDRSSLDAFVAAQEEKKKEASRALTQMREKEYQLARERRAHIEAFIQSKTATKQRARAKAVWSNAYAIAIAVLVVVSAMNFAQVLQSATFLPRALSLINETAYGFSVLVGEGRDAFATYAQTGAGNVASASVASRAASREIVIGDMGREFVAPDTSALQMPIAITNAPMPHGVHVSDTSGQRISFAAVAQTIASPVETISTLKEKLWRTYVSLGFATYGVVTASMDGYLSLIQNAGAGALAAAGSAHDLFALAPGAISSMNLAFGKAVISLTHQIIDTEVAFVYALAGAGPASAHTTVALLIRVGDSLERTTAQVPALAVGTYLGTAQLLANAAPMAAQAAWSVEYAVGSHFVSGLNTGLAFGAAAVGGSALQTYHAALAVLTTTTDLSRMTAAAILGL